MTLISLTQIKITKQAPAKGSNRTAWNMDVNGRPFGQIWTFKAKGEIHPFHAKTLTDAYAAFPTYAEAEEFMRGAI